MADGPLGIRNSWPRRIAAGIAGRPPFDRSSRVAWARSSTRRRARAACTCAGPRREHLSLAAVRRTSSTSAKTRSCRSRMAFAYIRGVQTQGVQRDRHTFIATTRILRACHRHRPLRSTDAPARDLPALFEAAAPEAHVGAIMSAYPRGRLHLTQPSGSTTRWSERVGFDGVPLSDWMGDYDGGRPPPTPAWIWRCPSGRYMKRRATAAAPNPAGQGPRWHQRRQSAPHPAQCDQLGCSTRIRPTQMASVRARGTQGRRSKHAPAGWCCSRTLATVCRSTIRRSMIAVIVPTLSPAIPVGGGSAQLRPFVAVTFLEGLTLSSAPALP